MLGAAMKKFLAITIAFAALTGPVFAQNKQQRRESPLQAEETQKKKDAEKVDQQYREMLRRTAGQSETPARVDPWQNMRQVESAQPKN